jgi:hypothetical protein
LGEVGLSLLERVGHGLSIVRPRAEVNWGYPEPFIRVQTTTMPAFRLERL